MKIVSEIEKKLIAQFNSENSHLEEKHSNLKTLFELCESPIEQKLLFHFTNYFPGYPCDWEGLHILSSNFCEPHFMGFDLRIYPQREMPISTILTRKGTKLYAADFLFRLTRWNHDKGITETLCELVIEVDDNNCQENTKKHSNRDKSRDRTLTVAGYTLIRFTMSELFRKMDESISEIYSFLILRVRDFVAQRGLKFY